MSVEAREVEKLTSRASPPLSLLPSSTQGGLATLMTLSGEPAHCGPSPSDKCGLPRHSGAGERTRKEEGGCGGYYQGDSLVFSTIRTQKNPPMISITKPEHCKWKRISIYPYSVLIVGNHSEITIKDSYIF